MKFVFNGLLSLLLTAPLTAQTTNTLSTNVPPPAPNPAETMPVVTAQPLTDTSPPRDPALDAAAAPITSEDPFSDPLVQQVVARHEKAVNGDKKETKALTADLERWTKDEPGNYLLLAYLGSAYTLSSRDSWPGPGKISFLRKGGKALDAAVTGDPTNPAVRFVRAINYYELPAIFGKHQIAHDDFQYLMQQVRGVLPMPFTLKADTVQAICYYAGMSDVQFSDPESAKEDLQQGWKVDPKSKLGMKIQAELGKLK